MIKKKLFEKGDTIVANNWCHTYILEVVWVTKTMASCRGKDKYDKYGKNFHCRFKREYSILDEEINLADVKQLPKVWNYENVPLNEWDTNEYFVNRK